MFSPPQDVISVVSCRLLCNDVTHGKMVTENCKKSTWKTRLVAFSCYFGGAPALWFLSSHRAKSLVEHHLRQSTAIFMLLAVVVLTFAVTIVGLSYALVFERAWYEAVRIEGHMLNFTRKFFLCWLVFWVYGGASALLGSAQAMPIVRFLACRNRLVRSMVLLIGLGWLAVACIAPFAVHASTLARQDEAPGQVYLLYDDLNKFPRWIFALGFYRISLTAAAQWGDDSIVAVKLTETTLEHAVRNGRFVFIASHGKAEGLLMNKKFVKPGDVEAMGINPGIEFVYLTSCDSGTQKKAWEDAFAPAKVVTFDRLTAIIEHAWWMWFRGPRQIAAMK